MPGLDGLGVIRKLRETRRPAALFRPRHSLRPVRGRGVPAGGDGLPAEAGGQGPAGGDIDRARASDLRSGHKWRPARAAAAPASPQRTKLLVRSANRNFIVDAQDVIYATIDDGLITIVATNLEGQSNYRTIEELQSNLDPENFWRVHRSYLVNINRIKEVIPWFKSSYQLRMDDKKQTEIPVSRVQTKRLRELLKL